MSLDLDVRQRAMLAEMGVRLFEAPPVVGVPAQRPATAAPRRAPQAEVAVVEAPALQPSPAAPPAGRVPVGDAGPAASMDWDTLASTVAACQACGLCHTRRNTVFGMGDRQADWMVIGEAPGENEDLRGEPFVGQAGKLLDNMLRAVGVDREQGVYISNVLKCRPPGNRNPQPEEVAQCEPFLRRQVALVRPRVILAMGRFAVQALLGTTEPIGRLRGRVHHYQGVPVIVTFHPDYLLRNLPDKAKAWADLCMAMALVDQAPQ